jgi:hypothetical protein
MSDKNARHHSNSSRDDWKNARWTPNSEERKRKSGRYPGNRLAPALAKRCPL